MRKGWLITVLLLLLVAGAGVGGAISYGSDDTLPEGFEIGGLAVGGQKADAALKQLQARLAELEKQEVTVTPPKLNGKADVSLQDPTRTLKQLGMTIDASEAVKAIEEFRDASMWDRAKLRYLKKIKSDYGFQVAWDEEQLRKTATTSWSSAAVTPPKAATRTINERDEVVYTQEVIGTELDIPALLAAVRAIEPKSLSTGVSEMEESRVIELPVTQKAPDVTVAKLKEEGIDRKIVEFATSFATSGEGRSHNVTVAAKALNETLLMPDEIFEYGKIVDKADKKYGYKEAPVILNGKLTPGIGGGICQVSSTLYNAALLSGLEIVERRHHSLVVHYLPKGLDATFADGFINFKFRNSTGKQLLIRTVVEDKTLTVKLFGTMPDSVSYRTETVELKVNPPKTVYVANAKLALGKQDTLQTGEAGYVVESYRIKLVNGEVAERTKLYKDTYRAQDFLIAVNPNDPRLNPEDSTPTPEPTPSPGGEEGPVEPV
jgi:vancomycin resistance protein YoaR